MFFFGTTFSTAKLVCLVPVILGVVLATYGEYYFTTMGFFLTLLGTFLAALKTIYTNVLQSRSGREIPPKAQSASSALNPQMFLPPRLNLHPLDLLGRMSPLAFMQCVLYAYLSGELSTLFGACTAPGYVLDHWRVLLLLGNGCIAFGLNIVSFTANGRVGALNMTVAGKLSRLLLFN